MNDLIVVEKIAQWQRLKALVLNSVSSPITKRVYNMPLDEFMGWFRQEPPAASLTPRTPTDERLTLVFALGANPYPLINYEIRNCLGDAAERAGCCGDQ